VCDALTTVDGLAGWWTHDTKGSGDLGRVLEFRFAIGGFDMDVVELRPGDRESGGWPTARRSGSGRRSAGTFARSATTRSWYSPTRDGGSR
jgi:hypothetical protein